LLQMSECRFTKEFYLQNKVLIRMAATFEEKKEDLLACLSTGVSFGRAVRKVFGVANPKYVKCAISYYPDFSKTQASRYIDSQICMIVVIVRHLMLVGPRHKGDGVFYYVDDVYGRNQVFLGTGDGFYS